MTREGSSLSVRPSAFLHDGWTDFLHIGYHDQVPWATDACKTEFGSVPHLSNYGNFFNKFRLIVLSQRRVWGFKKNIWYSYQVWCIAHASKIAFASVPNLSNYCHLYWWWYLREEWVNFVPIWYKSGAMCCWCL